MEPHCKKRKAGEISEDAPKGNAIATLVMLNEEYVLGALTLARSLQNVGSPTHRICLVDASISAKARALLSTCYEVIHVELLSSPKFPTIAMRSQSLPGSKEREALRRYDPWMQHSFTKFRVVELTRFAKILFLDADMLVVNPIEDLFDLPAPAGIWGSLGNGIERHGTRITEKEEKDLSKHMIRGSIWLCSPNQEMAELLQLMARKYEACASEVDTLAYPDEIILSRAYAGEWTHIHRGYCIGEYTRDSFEFPALQKLGNTKPSTEAERGRLLRNLHLPYFRCADFLGPKPWSTKEPYPDFKRWDALSLEVVLNSPVGLQLDMCAAFENTARNTVERERIRILKKVLEAGK